MSDPRVVLVFEVPVPESEERRLVGHDRGAVSDWKLAMSVLGRHKDDGSSNAVVVRKLS